MDITPVIPENKKIITSYGGGMFKVGEEKFTNNIIVFPGYVIDWGNATYEDLTINSFNQVISDSKSEILLIGCGNSHKKIKPEIIRFLMANNISAEIMTTGAACRTYNVLLAEGRDVAAALILAHI